MALIPPTVITSVLGKAKAVLTSKWFWAAIFLVGVIGGVTYTLNHWKDDAVETAVAGADDKSTIQTYETQETIDGRTQDIDRQYTKRREQTIKDYAHARNRLQTSPEAERNAQAPSVLIDTLNELDRLRVARESDGVPDPEVPSE